ncbi:helix-turn-helix domain-containing protein [Candidatus Electronema sp. PJ]|uniref:AlbA family DNA-binding domain-containing protein n=1 Tax=Candidatus Electronema sp. PJ TaxID=3401572 RepID=UPI003AA9AB1B
MDTPRTLQDIEKLIAFQTPESLHLDYKAGSVLTLEKKDELCKDVSALANSDGGVLIYGIKEEKIHKVAYPVSIDEGVDTSKVSKEWLEQILTSNITPIISGVEIFEIKSGANRAIVVIQVAKSFRGPHQAPDKKYYKRRNVFTEPMEHYEIEDIRNRKQFIPSLVNMDVQLSGFQVQLVIENIGNEVAHNVKFIFSDNFSWYKRRGLPHALKNGIKFFPPGRKITFYTEPLHILLNDKSGFDPFFDVAITYFHPQASSEVTEDIHINLKDFLNSAIESNYLKKISSTLDELSKITSELNTVNNHLQHIESIAGATGLDLSISTLTNINKIFKYNGGAQCVTIEHCDPYVLQEVLEVDFEMASNIYFYYHNNYKGTPIEEIPGMTEELLEKLRKLSKTII